VTESVVIERRFRGPDESGNGGYSCGLVARLVDGPAWVSLRRPPPLERSLAVVRRAGGAVELRDGDELVAEGGPEELEVNVPAPVSVEEAERAAANFALYEDHPFPGCFVCGPGRGAGDGLRIFPGKVDSREVVAASWTPDEGLAGPDGAVTPEVVWAVLDCPTSFGTALLGVMDVSVLARLAARITGRVEAGRPHAVIGWPLAREGRKSEGGAAIFDADGRLLAYSRGLWIALRT
jgi:hypothetical protein